jgi:hypothetical protein
MLALAVVSGLGGSTFTVVVEVDSVAAGGGVVVLGTTTVVSFDAVVVGAGVVVEVVVWRSHAARDTPRVRAATRGISFMCSPVEVCEAIS